MARAPQLSVTPSHVGLRRGASASDDDSSSPPRAHANGKGGSAIGTATGSSPGGKAKKGAADTSNIGVSPSSTASSSAVSMEAALQAQQAARLSQKGSGRTLSSASASMGELSSVFKCKLGYHVHPLAAAGILANIARRIINRGPSIRESSPAASAGDGERYRLYFFFETFHVDLGDRCRLTRLNPRRLQPVRRCSSSSGRRCSCRRRRGYYGGGEQPQLAACLCGLHSVRSAVAPQPVPARQLWRLTD